MRCTERFVEIEYWRLSPESRYWGRMDDTGSFCRSVRSFHHGRCLHLLNTTGFHPVSPVDGVYLIGSTLFSKVSIRMDPQYIKG